MRKNKVVTDVVLGEITVFYTECDNPKCSAIKTGPSSGVIYEPDWYTIHFQGTLWDGGPYVEELHFHAPECVEEWAKDRRAFVEARDKEWKIKAADQGLITDQELRESGIIR